MNRFSRRAFVGDRELELTKISFDILAELLQSRDGVISTSDLIRRVWGYEQTGRLGFAYTAVYRLRKELASAGATDVIESIRGVGFRIPGSADLRTRAAELVLEPAARRALEACATSIIIQDRNRRIVWANPAAEALTGYSVDELIALPSGEALSPGKKRPLRDSYWREVLAGRERRHSEVAFKHRDGHVIYVNSVWRGVLDEDGHFQYALLESWLPISEPELEGVRVLVGGAPA